MMYDPMILVLNPGSTSTKIAVFRGEEKLLNENIFHSTEKLKPFKRIADQLGFRLNVILAFLNEHRLDPDHFTAVAGRGGMLRPMASGTYRVTEGMVDFLMNHPVEHASNLGAILAYEIGEPVGRSAYIVDPIVVDEMEEVARVTGFPEIPRCSIFHALNQKAAAREAARRLEKEYDELRLIVAHLGGGISVGAHRQGRVVDVNNALNGEGPMGPERAGTLPAWQLVELALSSGMSKEELKQRITGQGGLTALLGTHDIRKVKLGMEAGEERCALVYAAMAYQVAKEIGAMAAVLEGRIDAVVFTGGMAHDEDFLRIIEQRVSFLAPIITLPGEDEMTALAQGVLRVLRGEEREKIWKG